MRFIVAFLLVLLEYRAPVAPAYRHINLQRLVTRFEQIVQPWCHFCPSLLPLLVILAGIIPVGVFEYFVGGLVFGLGELLLSLWLLLLCIGPNTYREYTDHQAPNSGDSSDFVAKALINGHEKIFAYLFWYLLGGIIPVLVYRGCQYYQNDTTLGDLELRLVHKLHAIMAIISTRVQGLLFCMLGRYRSAMKVWQQDFLNSSQAMSFLVRVGKATLEPQSAIQDSTPDIELLNLVHGTLVGLLFIAALVLLGSFV